MRVKDSKRMSRTTRLMCEDLLVKYNENKRELNRITNARIPSPTPSYSAVGGIQSNNPESRPTEEIAMSIIADARYRYLNECVTVTELFLRSLDELTRKIITLVYVNANRISIAAAAVVCDLAERTAYRLILDALSNLAQIAGYTP